MTNAQPAIVDEIDAAISAGSSEKGLIIIKRVGDLFLTSADAFDDNQIELFGVVLERLIKTIEIRAIADVSARVALAELSSGLAVSPKSPATIVRLLANNDEIAIAGPVLAESACLTAEDLIEIARSKSEQHLLAISGRWWLKEVVTDVILTRRYPKVSRRIVNNPGARVSAAGFAIVIAQAVSDPELAIETGIRVDLHAALRHQLLSNATEAVRSRLLACAPAHIFEEIRSAIAAISAGVDREMSKTRDFTTAKHFIAQLSARGEINEEALFDFAKQRKYEETVVALALLSQCTVEVIRPLMQSLRDDGVLVPCKAAGLHWKTVNAVLESRFAVGSMGSTELEKAEGQYARITIDDARRLLRFWQVRSSSSSRAN
jgi:uncharacterized protein (DUF2336 family)